jgi:hypothetical protein
MDRISNAAARGWTQPEQYKQTHLYFRDMCGHLWVNSSIQATCRYTFSSDR